MVATSRDLKSFLQYLSHLMIGAIINVDDRDMSKISERYSLPFIVILPSDILSIRPPKTLRRYCKGWVTLSHPEHLPCMAISLKWEGKVDTHEPSHARTSILVNGVKQASKYYSLMHSSTSFHDTNDNNHFLFQSPFAAQLATKTNSKQLEYTSPASTSVSTLLISNHVLQNSRN
jgi:hypothetical protein